MQIINNIIQMLCLLQLYSLYLSIKNLLGAIFLLFKIFNVSFVNNYKIVQNVQSLPHLF
jgi:hypothetical protein